METNKSEKILAELENGYDLIADKFSSTRAFMWRDLGLLKDYVKAGDKVLDFGCGNGRLAGFLENSYGEYIGIDISQKLLDIAKQKYSSGKNHFIKVGADFEKLPFKDNYFNAVFSIAVFHHFPSREYALKVAKELCRVLKPGGKIIVTVWNLWQEPFLRFDLKNLERSNLEDKSDWEGLYIPFKSGEKIFERYHHPFKIEELDRLFKEGGFKKIKMEKGSNLIYIGSKKNNPGKPAGFPGGGG